MEDNSKKINKWSVNGRILWIYIKYQIISKIIVGFVVFPLFAFVTNMLIKNSGRTSISSGDYLSFLMSFNGVLMLLFGILFLIVVLEIDINAFIIISALAEEKRLNIKLKNIVIISIKSLKHFFSPVGIFIVMFVALILPLLEIGITMGPLANFKIPNFISSVIFNNTLYNTLYILSIIVLTIISILYIFTIHFILIDKKSMREALKSSKTLIIKNWKNFIFNYVFKMIKIFFIFSLFLLCIIAITLLFSLLLSYINISNNVIIILILLSIFESFSFFAFLSVPIAISILTQLFYKYNITDGHIVKLNFQNKTLKLCDEKMSEKIRIKTKLKVILFLLLVISFNFIISFLMVENFDEIFKTDINMELVAHRGGGDLGAENTVEGIKQAIIEDVDWTEIDVQRTKDNKYIVNHDADFSRVSGVDESPYEMTLEEIKELRVKNEFFPEKESQEVATLEEILDVSKNKIGVFVELKGKTADYKMVDDVIKIIKDKNMLDECVILSLDYDIIEYTEKNYPEIKTGYLYYFSVGNLKDLKGDYLIMEEGEASTKNINEIHEANKKAIVWTVNTEESIQKFIYSDVDGIITDHIIAVKDAIKESKNRSHIEIIIDSFLRN